MPRVIHFEIQSDDPDDAAEFYSNVFNWVVSKKNSEDYWIIRTGGNDERGINGGFGKPRKKYTGAIPTIEVESVDKYAKKIEENGGKITRPKFIVPGTGYLAYCEDPQGTPFVILQYELSAK